MNAWTPTPAEPPFDDAQAGGGGAGARVERQQRMLDRLAEAGMNIVLAIERQATQAPEDAPAGAPVFPHVFQGDLALSFARAARAVRMTIALQSRLVGEHHKQQVEARAQARMDELRHGPERKARIGRIVDRVAQGEHDDEAVERLVAEAAERLEDGDLYGEVMNRPVSEIIDEVCRDLDLRPNWSDLAQDGWAREEIASGAVGEPLAPFAAPPLYSSPPRPQHSSPSGPSRPEGRRNRCEGDGALVMPASPPASEARPPPPPACPPG